MKDQAVARELAGLGLPLLMHPGDTPDPPFDTPFSGVVHFLAKLTRGCASLHRHHNASSPSTSTLHPKHAST